MIKKYKVGDNNKDKRIDVFLSETKLNLSRMRIKKLIKSGNIKVNGKINLKEAYLVKENDEIEILIEEPKETKIEAENIKIDIIYEDEDILILNKQKGIVVHPGNGNTKGTLVNAILYHCKESLSGIGGEIRPGIVHRIDKDTSGLLIIAKNDNAHIDISNQIKERKVTKIYTALCKGVIPENRAKIDMPIGRSRIDGKKMTVRSDGKEAVTHIEVIERFKEYTLIKVKIDTGRTHQIRVHLSEIGYPILGDSVYSKGKNEFGIQGQMLHSTILEFVHPRTKEKLHFEAELPEEFQEIINKIKG